MENPIRDIDFFEYRKCYGKKFIANDLSWTKRHNRTEFEWNRLEFVEMHNNDHTHTHILSFIDIYYG